MVYSMIKGNMVKKVFYYVEIEGCFIVIIRVFEVYYYEFLGIFFCIWLIVVFICSGVWVCFFVVL